MKDIIYVKTKVHPRELKFVNKLSVKITTLSNKSTSFIKCEFDYCCTLKRIVHTNTFKRKTQSLKLFA